jgi:hypothetical protein
MARAIELVQERQRAIKNQAVRHGRPRALDLVKPPTLRERDRPLRGGRNPSKSDLFATKSNANFWPIQALNVPINSC